MVEEQGWELVRAAGLDPPTCWLEGLSCFLHRLGRHTMEVLGGFVEIPGVLEVHPEFRGGLQTLSKQQRRGRCDASFAVNQGVHPLNWDTK